MDYSVIVNKNNHSTVLNKTTLKHGYQTNKKSFHSQCCNLINDEHHFPNTSKLFLSTEHKKNGIETTNQ